MSHTQPHASLPDSGGREPMGDAGDPFDGGREPDAAADAPPSQVLYLFRGVDGSWNVSRLDTASMEIEPLRLAGLTDAERIYAISVSPDGRRLAVAGVPRGGGPFAIRVYPTSGASAPTTAFTAPLAGRRLSDLKFSPDARWLAFAAELEVDGAFDDNDDVLYVVAADGSAPARRVSHDVPERNMQARGSAWAGSDHLIFTGNLVDHDVSSIWSVDLASDAPPTELVPSSPRPFGDVLDPTIGLDAEGRVYFRSGHPDEHLYRCRVDGSSFEEVPGTSLLRDGEPTHVLAFGLSEDGEQLAFAADTVQANVFDVHVMSLREGVARRVTELPIADTSYEQYPSPDQPLRFSPDGEWLAFGADYELAVGESHISFELFVAPTSRSGGLRLLGASEAPWQPQTSAVTWSRDGAALFTIADYRSRGAGGLYGTRDLESGEQPLDSVELASSIYGIEAATVPSR